MRKKQMIAAGAAAVAVLVVLVVCLITFGRKKETEDAADAAASSEALIAEENKAEDAEEKSEKKKQDTKKDQTKEEETELETEEEETQMEAKPMVQNSGISVSGTSAENSFDIPMSDLYTFTDPSLSFDTRYVLYGGSGCMMAKQASAQGYTCLGAYEILYTSGGSAAAEYKFWVMGSVSDAIGWEAYMSPNYNDSNCSTSRHGDVVCLYSKGSYVQKSYIDFYYKQGVIESATAKAYLKMPFFFNGMSDYHGSGSKPSGDSGNTDPTPSPGPTPTPGPTPMPGPSGDDKENSKEIPITGSYTFKDPEGLDFDIRYVLICEDKNASAIQTVAGAAKANVTKVYEILYVKNGKAVAEYKCYAAANDTEAKKITELYQKQDGLHGDVAVLYNDEAMLDQMLDFGVKYGGMSAATPEAYLQYLMSTEGFKEYKGDGGSAPIPDPTPTPGPEPTPTPGPTPTPDPTPGPSGEEFVPDFTKIPTVQITKDYSFTDPEGLDYAVRFGAYGGKNSLFTKPQERYQAESYSDIVYADENGKAIAEYKFYVMKTEKEAKGLEQYFIKAYTSENENDSRMTVSRKGRVVSISDSGKTLQEMIDGWASMLSDTTVKAYFDAMATHGGLTVTEVARKWKPDFTKKPAVQITESYTFTDPADVEYDTRYVAYGGKDSVFVQTEMDSRVEGLCEILYSKDGNEVAWYKLYILPDQKSAEAKRNEMSNSVDVSLSGGNVVCVSYSKEDFQNYLGNFNLTTLKEYLEFMAVPFPNGLGLEYVKVTYETEGSEPEKPVATDKDNSPAFQMTNSYIFKNPEGLDFDSRYVLYGDEASGAVADIASMTGLALKEMYMVFYVKGGVPVGEYTYYTAADEAEAKKCAAMGLTAEKDVAFMYSDQATLAIMISQMVQAGWLEEETPVSYLQYAIKSKNLKPIIPKAAADQSQNASEPAAQSAEDVQPETIQIPSETIQALQVGSQAELLQTETEPQPEPQPEKAEPESEIPAAALPETAEDVMKKTAETGADEPAEAEEPEVADENAESGEGSTEA